MTDVPDPQSTPAAPPPPEMPATPPLVPDAPPPPPLSAPEPPTLPSFAAPPPPPPPPPPTAPDALPAYAPPPAEPPKGGGRGKLAGVAIAIVVVLLAGAFAVSALSSSSGGASSPDEAVAKMFDAIANEDVIGVLDTLDPGERDLMVPTVKAAKDQLVRLGLVEEVDLGKVPGVDIEVTGLQTQSEQIYDGVDKVTITDGHISASTQPDAVPVGSVLRDLIDATGGDASIPDATDEADLGGSDTDAVIAVQRDGGWYVSLFYTAAEEARVAAGLDPPDPKDAIAPQGASSPEAAVTDFLNAVGSLDLRSIIAHLPPKEMAALQLYAPLFVDDAQQSIDEFKADSGFKLSVSDLDLSSSDGDLGKVVSLHGGTLTVDADDGTLSVTVRDGCISLDAQGSASDVLSDFSDVASDGHVCVDDLQSSFSSDLSDFSDLSDLGGGGPFAAFSELGARLGDAHFGLVVVHEDGGWYVSPVRSVIEPVLQLLQALDKADFQEGGFIFDLLNGG